MDSGNVVVFAIVLILLVTVFVGVVNYYVPFFKKIEIQSIGKRYFQEMEVNAGLTASQALELENLLITDGFKNVTVTYSLVGTVKRNEDLILRIDTEYPLRTYGIFSSAVSNLEIDFEQTVVNRKVEE